jgi:hypothetical protein
MNHSSQQSLEAGGLTPAADARSSPAAEPNAAPLIVPDYGEPAPRPTTSPGFEAMRCPQCGSTQLKRVWPLLRMLIGSAVLSPLMLFRSEGKMIFMVLVTIWIPCTLVSLSWRCRKCGTQWKPAGLTARPPLAQQTPVAPEDKPQ